MTIATTDQKARMFDLFIGVGELVRDGKRPIGPALEVLQFMKDKPEGAERLLAGLRQASPTSAVPAPTAKPVAKLSLFADIRTVAIPARTEPFVVSDEFACGKRGIIYVDPAFLRSFGDLVEAPMPPIELRYARLARRSKDGPILKELGEKAEVALAHVGWLLGSGSLPAEVRWLIFYVRGQVVHVRRSSGGWHVNVDSVTNPGPWDAGDYAFSRNS